MSEAWQQIAVWTMIALAAAYAVYSGISAWRSLRKGECNACSKCGSGHFSAKPAGGGDRVVFLPADQLRASTRVKKH